VPVCDQAPVAEFGLLGEVAFLGGELGRGRAALKTGRASIAWNAAVELEHIDLDDALALVLLIGDRPRGPLFLTDRRPAPGRAPALADICPFTGRARLSYRRAEEIFRDASGGWTLHQLRHSAITHLAEDNVALPMLMAKSRHTSLRSLQKYARPSADAVAALTAAHDPERRRR